MRSVVGLAPLLLVSCDRFAPPEVPARDPVSLVNPFIGTGGPGYRVGSATPAAGLPWGMVKVGPDTALDFGSLDAYHCSGYYYDDNWIEGFSHFHLYGTGSSDYGNFLFMPTDGWDPSKREEMGYRQTFSHDNESARPGSYHVTLDDGIDVTLAATAHAAHHHYDFPDTVTTPTVVIDLEHVLGGGAYGGEVHIDPDTGEVWGSMLDAGGFTGRYGGFTIWFVAEFDGGIADFGTWADDEGVEGRADASGVDLGAWIEPAVRDPDIRVGISLTGLDGARANLAAELPEQDISETIAQAEAAWTDALSTVEIDGGTDDERTIFTTALFHAIQMPQEHSDANGDYSGFDDEIHESEADGGARYYSDFSLWDTYRDAHSLYDLLYPDRAAEFAQSLLRMAQQGGAFPRWPTAGGDSTCMIGAPADVVLSETWQKGIHDWDMASAWPLMRAQAMGEGSYSYNGRPDVSGLEKYGYIPADDMGGSVAWTQELAWADAALAQLAGNLGQNDDAAHFAWRSHTFRNQYDPAIGFFHARFRDGTFDPDFDEISWRDEYVEGNAWQYLWMPFPNYEDLADVLGGREAALAKLNQFFEKADEEGVLFGPQTYYWHGNEPDIHASFLFRLWGDPDASLYWQRWIRETHYANDPHGLAGNDDAGTLSSWYVFSALGFYPIAGTVYYVVGVPLFDEARIQVDGGVFTIRREGDGDHVSRVILNGVELDRATIRHDEIVAGGSLVVYLE